MKRALLSLIFLSLLSCSVLAQVSPVPQLMNFQGRLAKPDGTPVSDGTYSVRFSLWDAATNGTEKWNQTVNPVNVKNGVFGLLLSGFTAGTFNGNLWLEIKVGTAAPLTPRQQLVSVAYAMKANSVPDGSIGAAQIANGSLTADKFTSNLLNPLAWLLGGNSGTTSSNFLGTIDNQPLVFKVNNRRAMRYQYAENTATAGQEYRSINMLGGSEINTIGAGVVGATIAGGGQDFFAGGQLPNRVTADFGTVGGGFYNYADGYAATVGGGYANSANGGSATVGGGVINIASGAYATVGGGDSNYADGYAATVGGGEFNTASGGFATVGGGYNNTAARTYSFAAGQQAQANHDGTFVWNDASDTFIQHYFASTGDNQFLIHATGGVGINTNNPAGFALNVAGTAQMTGFKLPTGANAGSVLLSDASGNGTWGQVTGAGIANGSIGAAQIAAGSITADKFAANAFNPLTWLLGGNSGTDPTINFLGTTDNQSLVFKVNNHQAMRYSYAENPPNQYRSINVLGGSEINSITAGVVGATIAGGGYDSFTGTDYPNSVTGNFGTVGGGFGNTASAYTATVAGGDRNIASGESATVGGGDTNTASAYAATVAGGLRNKAAGQYSFAAGYNAQANHDGTFVWNDSTNAIFASTASNQFLIHATGGVGVNTNTPAGFALNVNGTANFAGNITVNGTSYTSDARYKTNVTTFGNALDAILNLRGVTFDWKPTPGMNFAGGRQIGFIAQEVEKVLPELVTTDSKGYKSVAYANVVPVLVEAVKALNSKVERLQTLERDNAAVRAENGELKATLAALLKRVEQLEQRSGGKN